MLKLLFNRGELMIFTEPLSCFKHAVDQVASDCCQTACLDRISQLGHKTIKCIAHDLYHASLCAAKLIAITLEVATLAIVASGMALTLLACLPFQPSLEEAQKNRVYRTLSSIYADVIEVVKITLIYGLVKDGEEYQKADNTPQSPQFVLIRPNQPKPSAKPILYAPGYLDTPDSLRETCRKLANINGSVVYIVSYRNLFQSIEEHAKDSSHVAMRIIKDTGQNELILAGHSMGGLVTGCMVLDNLVQNVVYKHWITMGSPLKGDPLAHLGYGECAKEMNLDSSLIKRLNEPSHLDDIPSLHFGSDTDMIVPAQFALREGHPNAKNYLCKLPHGHISIRDNSEVFHELQVALNNI